MKELFTSFKNYAKFVRHAPARQSTVARVLLVYALFMAYIMIEAETCTYTSSEEVISFSDPFLMFNFMALFAVHLTYHSLKYKPNMSSLAPINYKRRVVFDVIYPLIMAILTLLVIALIALVIALLLLFVFPSEYEEEEYAFIGMGTLAVFFRFLFAYGCNIISACQKTTKRKAISFIGFIVVYFIATVLTGLAINGFNTELGYSAMYAIQFNDMPLPWLGYTLWAIAGIGAMVAAVLYLIKFEKPREY